MVNTEHSVQEHRALIVGLINGKGGVGKSTISMNSAIALHDRKRNVAFIDAEEYGPNAEVINDEEPSLVTRSATTTFAIDDALSELRPNHEIIFLDAPGKNSGDEVATICSLADLVIVPIKPSKKDIRQTKPVLRMIKHCQLRQNGKPEVVIVLNETKKNSRAAAAYRAQLTEFGLYVAESEIRDYEYHQSHDFVTRNPDTRTNGHKCAQDIESFIDEILEPKLKKTAAPTAPHQEVANA